MFIQLEIYQENIKESQRGDQNIIKARMFQRWRYYKPQTKFMCFSFFYSIFILLNRVKKTTLCLILLLYSWLYLFIYNEKKSFKIKKKKIIINKKN